MTRLRLDYRMTKTAFDAVKFCQEIESRSKEQVRRQERIRISILLVEHVD